MHKEKQYIKKLTIEQAQANHYFQLTIPLDCKTITGIKVSLSPKNNENAGLVNYKIYGFISLQLPHQIEEFYANDVKEYNEYHPLSIPNRWEYDPYENIILGGVSFRNYHINNVRTPITGIYKDYLIHEQDYFFNYQVTIYLHYKTQ